MVADRIEAGAQDVPEIFDDLLCRDGVRAHERRHGVERVEQHVRIHACLQAVQPGRGHVRTQRCGRFRLRQAESIERRRRVCHRAAGKERHAPVEREAQRAERPFGSQGDAEDHHERGDAQGHAGHETEERQHEQHPLDMVGADGRLLPAGDVAHRQVQRMRNAEERNTGDTEDSGDDLGEAGSALAVAAVPDLECERQAPETTHVPERPPHRRAGAGQRLADDRPHQRLAPLLAAL